jgi:hypothetical protein
VKEILLPALFVIVMNEPSQKCVLSLSLSLSLSLPLSLDSENDYSVLAWWCGVVLVGA